MASTAPARAINANFNPSTRAFASNQTNTLAIHGDSVVTDRTYLADAEKGLRDLNSTLVKDITRRVMGFADSYEALLFNGSGADGNIKGLKTILDGSTTIPGFTATYRVKNAKGSTGDSLDVSAQAGQKKLIELLCSALHYQLV